MVPPLPSVSELAQVQQPVPTPTVGFAPEHALPYQNVGYAPEHVPDQNMCYAPEHALPASDMQTLPDHGMRSMIEHPAPPDDPEAHARADSWTKNIPDYVCPPLLWVPVSQRTFDVALRIEDLSNVVDMFLPFVSFQGQTWPNTVQYVY